MQSFSLGDNLHEMSKTISGKIESYFKMSSAEIFALAKCGSEKTVIDS